jgi:diacylglycerol kinase family enzyme
MLSSPLVILNATAGSLRTERALRNAVEAVRSSLPESQLALVRGRAELLDALDRARSGMHERVYVGGGDGTVRAVAEAISGTGKILGVLPLGTINHFARRIGLPLDLRSALSALARGSPWSFNLGEVNGKTFINNSTLGLYPAVVRARDYLRYRKGVSKWGALAMIAGRTMARVGRTTPLELRTEDGRIFTDAPFVFVTNHDYRLGVLPVGEDEIPPDQLGVCVVAAESSWHAMRIAASAALGTLASEPSVRTLQTRTLTVSARTPRLHVTLDGEVHALATPLRYSVRTTSLRVLAPAGKSEPAPGFSLDSVFVRG